MNMNGELSANFPALLVGVIVGSAVTFLLPVSNVPGRIALGIVTGVGGMLTFWKKDGDVISRQLGWDWEVMSVVVFCLAVFAVIVRKKEVQHTEANIEDPQKGIQEVKSIPQRKVHKGIRAHR